MEVAAGLREILELVEEDGLPRTPEAGHELALGIPAAQESLQGDVHGVDFGIPAHQGGWPCAGSWVVGILDRIHGRLVLYSFLPYYIDFL